MNVLKSLKTPKLSSRHLPSSFSRVSPPLTSTSHHLHLSGSCDLSCVPGAPRCTVCGHASMTFDPFWDLSLPIPSKSGQLRLQSCFDLFTKEEVLDGDEKPVCDDAARGGRPRRRRLSRKGALVLGRICRSFGLTDNYDVQYNHIHTC